MSEERLTALLAAVNGAGKILILPHNDPDPDAVASAVALHYLLTKKLDVEVTVAYHGMIGRAENKALVNYLGHPLQAITGLDEEPLSAVALVDTQPGAGNNALSPQAAVAIVLDHHPWREPTASARYADVRPAVGATSTLLTEYLQAAGLEPDRRLATALFYGIKTDTMCLSRNTSPADIAAYVYLQPRADNDALVKIERAQVPIGYFKSFDTTLRAARLYEQVVVSYIGSMAYPDLAAEMADMLLRLEGSEWVICMGLYRDELILSIRTRSRGGGAGQLAQAVIDSQGTAGGHGAMAGGHIPLNGRKPNRLAGRIGRRVLQHLNIRPETKGQSLV